MFLPHTLLPWCDIRVTSSFAKTVPNYHADRFGTILTLSVWQIWQSKRRVDASFSSSWFVFLGWQHFAQRGESCCPIHDNVDCQCPGVGYSWRWNQLATMCGNWHDISWQLVRCIVTIGAIYRTSCHERHATHWTVSCFRYKDTHIERLSESHRACSINDGKRSLSNFPRRSRRFRRYKKQSVQ